MSLLSWTSKELKNILNKSADVLAEYAINEARKPSCSPNTLISIIESESDQNKHNEISTFVRDLIQKVRPIIASQSSNHNVEQQRKIALIQSNARFNLVDDQVETKPIKRDSSHTAPTSRHVASPDNPDGDNESSSHRDRSSRRSESSRDNERSSRRKRSRSRSEPRSPDQKHRLRDSDDRKSRRDHESSTSSSRKDQDSSRSRRSDQYEHRSSRYDDDRSTRSKREDDDRSNRSKRDDDDRSSRSKREDDGRHSDDRSLAGSERTSLWGPVVEDDKKPLTSSISLGTSVKPAYHMPDSYVDEDGKANNKKRFGLLDSRDDQSTKRLDDRKPRQIREYELWEQEQLKNSKLAVGVDRLIENTSDQSKKQYDFVFDETAVDMLPGHDDTTDSSSVNQSINQDISQSINSEAPLSPRAELEQTRRSLPIFPYRESLLEAVAMYQALIVVGETGSGKTTQIMQYLYESGYCSAGKSICCTQPRRVAAMSVAARVAEEVGCELGTTVGYSIRFEDRTSAQTRIKYMTDGMLIRELMTQSNLEQYSVIMIDEAHERTLSTDVLFGFIKTIMKVRPELKILISSATIAAEKFSQYFNGAPLFFIPGRRFPVDVYYTKQPEADYVDATVASLMQIHRSQPLGDVLVFLTGQEEIEQAMDLIEQRLEEIKQSNAKSLNMSKSDPPPIELLALPLYSALPVESQSLIFEPTPPNTRKVVLATNIAETSLTIHGIVYVIDCGFSKQKTFNAQTGLESLVVTPISRASANQRAGRAGRVQPGKCFRLYTKHAFYSDMLENAIPEIKRTNLVHAVLMLKSLKIDNVQTFDYMDHPGDGLLTSAVNELTTMEALDATGKLTELGRRMSELPVEPHLAKTLLGSERFECSEEMLSVCAMLGVGAALFTRPKAMATQATAAHRALAKASGERSDHLMLLYIYQEWCKAGASSRDWCFDHFIQHRSMKRAKDIREQLSGLCSRVHLKLLSSSDNVKLLKALASGFFHQIAKLDRSGTYRTLKKKLSVSIHPSSVLNQMQPPPQTVIYHELVLTKKEYMRNCSVIELDWLKELAPQVFSDLEKRQESRGHRQRGNPSRAERERHHRGHEQSSRRE